MEKPISNPFITNACLLIPLSFIISNTTFASEPEIFDQPPTNIRLFGPDLLSNAIAIITFGIIIVLLLLKLLAKLLELFDVSITIEKGKFQIITGTSRQNRTLDESAAQLEQSVATSTNNLLNEFEERARRIMDSIAKNITDESSAQIDEAISKIISNKLGDNVINYIDEELSSRVNTESRWSLLNKDIVTLFQSMSSRAVRYADTAARQAEYYKSFAVYLSIFGILLLFMFVILNLYDIMINNAMYINGMDWRILFLRNGPPLSLVLLIEFLAGLMFRNSMKSLEYMKYFSNEGSNINARQSAYVAAIKIRNEKKLEKIIDSMIALERNLILKKNERTSEIEMNKLEDNFFSKYKPRFIYQIRPSNRTKADKSNR